MVGRARRIPIIICACLFLIMTVSGTAFAAGAGTHPHIWGTDRTKITSGCTDITVHGNGFTPSTVSTTNHAGFFVVASTDGKADGFAVLPVDTRGRTSGVFHVCGITVSPELIEYVAGDELSGFFSNTEYAKAK